MEFQKLYLILLRDGPVEEPDSEEEMDLIRKEHGNYQSMLHANYGGIAGPLRGPREDIQGITLLPGGELSLDEATVLAQGDPAVKAGYLRAQVVEWYTGKGLLELRPMPRD